MLYNLKTALFVFAFLAIFAAGLYTLGVAVTGVIIDHVVARYVDI